MRDKDKDIGNLNYEIDFNDIQSGNIDKRIMKFKELVSEKDKEILSLNNELNK